jgi:protein-tyrosine phosphatase
VKAVLEAGVDTFVCLQERRELSRFTPYMPTARKLAVQPEVLRFLHCPIPDTYITTDADLAKAVATIIDLLREGRVIYVHCWGGHGRTGTVVCALLVKAYGLTTKQAGEVFMAGESARKERRGHWPHGSSQFDQVQRMEREGPELSAERLGPLEDW